MARNQDAPAILGKSLRYQSGHGSAKDPGGRLARAYYLERYRAIANGHGGKLLSPEYLGDAVKLRFKCTEGHEFLAAPTHVKQGKWCKTCRLAGGYEKRKAPTIARFQEIVRKRGGLVLTPLYMNSQTRLRLQCASGHQWEVTPNSILQGRWCRFCALADPRRFDTQRRTVLLRLRRMLRARGGKLLSEFGGLRAPVEVECARGHRWKAAPEVLDGVTWCRACKEEDLLQEVRTLVARQGGECLSERVPTSSSELKMICARGHRWDSCLLTVRLGHWCPTCRGGTRFDIELARRSARAHGGECLSTSYENYEIPMRWRCGEGHIWKAKLASILVGHWCRVCVRGWGRSRALLSIEIMREMAAERGGACLSENYRGIYDRLRWQCARGHTWETPANNVRRGGWCPTCSHSTLTTLNRMKVLAQEHDGRCVTTSWLNRSEPLVFECSRGHRFKQHANVVKTGVWCPECRERPAGAPRARRAGARLEVR